MRDGESRSRIILELHARYHTHDMSETYSFMNVHTSLLS